MTAGGAVVKLEALAFLLPLALYVSPLFYSFDQKTVNPNDRPTMVTRAECEAALSDPSLVIEVNPAKPKDAKPDPVDLSICETLGDQYVAVMPPATSLVAVNDSLQCSNLQ